MVISVIVPIYNAEVYLEDCLESIISQDYKDLEIILVNDGSTDNSLSICEQYADADERIRIINQENRGLVRARKVGISAATGDYISFVDADDYIDTDMYSKLVGEITRTEQGSAFPDILTFGHVEEYKDHCVLVKDRFECGFYDRGRLQSEIIPHMLSKGDFFSFGMLPNLVCKLIKKSFLDECTLRVSDNVMIGEDADMFFQLLPQAENVKIVDCYPYHYRKYDTSMMQKSTDIAAIESLYEDLDQAFKRLGIADIMKHQLDEYITFIRLLKAPESVPFIKELFSGDTRIALYGAGGFGSSLYGRYKEKIAIWCDQAYGSHSGKGMPVVSPDELVYAEDRYDVVFIAILKIETCVKMEKELLGNGISKRIYYYRK